MKTQKPKIQRSYVQVRDPDSREMRHVTVYNATPNEVVRLLKGESREPGERKRKREPAPT